MAKAQERDQIPYPIDDALIQEAQMIGSGAYVHDLNRGISEYRYAVKQWNERFECHLWYRAVQAERTLRGTIACAKSNRPFHAPWATRPNLEADHADE